MVQLFSWLDAVVGRTRDPPAENGNYAAADLREKARARPQSRPRTRPKPEPSSYKHYSDYESRRSVGYDETSYEQSTSWADTDTNQDDMTWDDSLETASYYERSIILKKAEQKKFERCEDLYLPLILRWKKAVRDEDVAAVEELVSLVLKKVNSFSASFIESYGLPQLMKESRYLLEDEDASISAYETLWKDMWFTYTSKAKDVPADFKPAMRKRNQDIVNAFVDSVEVRGNRASRPSKVPDKNNSRIQSDYSNSSDNRRDKEKKSMDEQYNSGKEDQVEKVRKTWDEDRDDKELPVPEIRAKRKMAYVPFHVGESSNDRKNNRSSNIPRSGGEVGEGRGAMISGRRAAQQRHVDQSKNKNSSKDLVIETKKKDTRTGNHPYKHTTQESRNEQEVDSSSIDVCHVKELSRKDHSMNNSSRVASPQKIVDYSEQTNVAVKASNSFNYVKPLHNRDPSNSFQQVELKMNHSYDIIQPEQNHESMQDGKKNSNNEIQAIKNDVSKDSSPAIHPDQNSSPNNARKEVAKKDRHTKLNSSNPVRKTDIKPPDYVKRTQKTKLRPNEDGQDHLKEGKKTASKHPPTPQEIKINKKITSNPKHSKQTKDDKKTSSNNAQQSEETKQSRPSREIHKEKQVVSPNQARCSKQLKNNSNTRPSNVQQSEDVKKDDRGLDAPGHEPKTKVQQREEINKEKTKKDEKIQSTDDQKIYESWKIPTKPMNGDSLVGPEQDDSLCGMHAWVSLSEHIEGQTGNNVEDVVGGTIQEIERVKRETAKVKVDTERAKRDTERAKKDTLKAKKDPERAKKDTARANRDTERAKGGTEVKKDTEKARKGENSKNERKLTKAGKERGKREPVVAQIETKKVKKENRTVDSESEKRNGEIETKKDRKKNYEGNQENEKTSREVATKNTKTETRTAHEENDKTKRATEIKHKRKETIAVGRKNEETKREIEKAKRETEKVKVVTERGKRETEKSKRATEAVAKEKVDVVKKPTTKRTGDTPKREAKIVDRAKNASKRGPVLVKRETVIAERDLPKVKKENIDRRENEDFASTIPQAMPDDINALSTATQLGFFSFADDSLIGTVETDPASLAVQQGGNRSFMDDTFSGSGDYVHSVTALGCQTGLNRSLGRNLKTDDFSVITMEQALDSTEVASLKLTSSMEDKVSMYEEALNEMTELRARKEIQEQTGAESERIAHTKSLLLVAIDKVTKLQAELEAKM